MMIMVKAKSLGLDEIQNGFDRWDKTDGSEEWQKRIYYALSFLYAFVCIVALVQLVRIRFRVPGNVWTTQKVFHLMNFIVNGLRAILFGLYKKVFLLIPKARGLPTDKLRPVYYIVNGCMYFLQVCIWIYVTVSQSPVAVEVSNLFLSVISFCAALGFMIYGGRLFFLLRCFPVESRGRQKKLYEVSLVTAICCTCFLIRCIAAALSAFEEKAKIDVLYHPILNFIYYMKFYRLG